MAAAECWRMTVICRSAEATVAADKAASSKRGESKTVLCAVEVRQESGKWSSKQRLLAGLGAEGLWSSQSRKGRLRQARQRNGRVVAQVAEDSADSTDSVKKGSTVQVTLQLIRQCYFGQKFYVCGDQDILGLWNLESAIKMQWSEGDVWTTQIEVPAGTKAEFKFVLLGKRGEVEWCPGPNKSFDISAGPSAQLLRFPWDDEELPPLTMEEEATMIASAKSAAEEVSDEAVDNAPNESAAIDVGVEAEGQAIGALEVLEETIALIDQILDEENKGEAHSGLQDDKGEETVENLEKRRPLDEGSHEVRDGSEVIAVNNEEKFEIRGGTGGAQENESSSSNGVAPGEEEEASQSKQEGQQDTALTSDAPNTINFKSPLSPSNKQSAVVEKGNGAVRPKVQRGIPSEGSVLAKDAEWGRKAWESLLGSLGRKPLMEEEPRQGR